MTEPIKLPPLPGCLTFYPLSDLAALDNYARLAVEQNTAELRARVAELEKDAARYRWLRHGDNDEKCIVISQNVSTWIDSNDVWLHRGEELDRVIEAALKEPK